MKDEIKALFFSESINFWKSLPRAPEFKYPLLIIEGAFTAVYSTFFFQRDFGLFY